MEIVCQQKKITGVESFLLRQLKNGNACNVDHKNVGDAVFLDRHILFDRHLLAFVADMGVTIPDRMD